MKLSKTSTYASLSLVYLAAQSHRKPIQARQVAEQLGIPTDSALKILQALARQRLISSQLGRAGGYRLLHPPKSISLLQIVEAIDDPIIAELPFDYNDSMPTQSICHLQNICEQAAKHLRQQLSDYTVADLACPINIPLAVAG